MFKPNRLIYDTANPAETAAQGASVESAAPAPEKRLDKTRKALENLGESVQGKNINGILNELKPGFDLDMQELGNKATEDVKTKTWEKIKTEVSEHILDKTPEKKDIDAFITDVENLGELKNIINAKDPMSKINELKDKATAWLESHGIPVAAVVSFFSFLGAPDEADDKETTKKKKWYIKIAEFFGYKPEEGGKDKTKETEKEEEDFNKSLVAIFRAGGFELDSQTIKDDKVWLKENNVEGATIMQWAKDSLNAEATVNKPKGNLNKLLTAAKKQGESGEKIKIPLKCIYFNKFETDKIAKLVTILEGNNTDYEFKSLKDAYNFLDKVVKATDFDTVLKRLKKQATPSQGQTQVAQNN